jgi:hypothetical protein
MLSITMTKYINILYDCMTIDGNWTTTDINYHEVCAEHESDVYG